MPAAAAPRRKSILDTAANGAGDHDDEEETPTPAALVPSGGRGFKKKSRKGIEVYLPGSGEVAVLKRPSLMALSAKGGRIPNAISAEVIKWIAVNEDILSKLTEEQQVENYQENAAVYIEIVALCMVYPKMITDREVDDDNDDEIGPGDLADRDYTFIVNRFVEGEAAALAPFLVAQGTRGGPSAR